MQLTAVGYLFYYGPPYGIAFSAMDKQSLNFLVSLICAAVNVALNMVLIPKYGALGAATSTIFTYALMKILYACCYRKLQIPLFDRSYPAIAGLALALTFGAKAFENYNLALVASVYFIVYLWLIWRLLLNSVDLKSLINP